MRYAFDLHLHSCLSPCGDDDMTPANLAGMCALAGLQVVALTDHNSCGNCAAFIRAAADYGLLALPGMELCTREEVHVVCLLPTLQAAAALEQEVYAALGSTQNQPEIFGVQRYMDQEDGLLGEETRMLAAAADIGLYDVSALVKRHGGVAFPAHIDRPSYALLSNLGLWDPMMGFSLAECSRSCPPGFLDRQPGCEGLFTIVNSDAHYLDQIMDAHQWMDLPALTPEAVLEWLRCPPERNSS